MPGLCRQNLALLQEGLADSSVWSGLAVEKALTEHTVVYILSGLHPHSCLHILTVVSSLSDYSPQHSPHSYFMIFSLVPILQYE